MAREPIEQARADEGERLLAQNDHRGALVAFEDALLIARQRQDAYAQAVYLANCGSASLGLDKAQQAERFLDEAMAFARKAGHTELVLDLHRQLAIACFEQRNPEGARVHVEAALQRAAEEDKPETEAELLGYMGIVQTMCGAHEDAYRYYQRGLELARELNATSLVGVITGKLGFHFVALSDHERALEHFERALQIARERDDRDNEAKWMSGAERCQSHLKRLDDPRAKAADDYSAALRSHEAAATEEQLELWFVAARSSRVARDYQHCADALANAGILLNDLGRYAEADEKFADAIDVLRATPDERRRALFTLNRGISLRDRGDVAGAIQAIGDAVRSLHTAGSTVDQTHALRALAGVQLAAGDSKESLCSLKEMERLSRESDDDETLAETLLQQASIVGDVDEAERLLREALARAESAGLTTLVAVAAMHLGSTLGSQQRTADAIAEMKTRLALVKSEAAETLRVQYCQTLASLTGTNGDDREIDEVWEDALDAAEQIADLPAIVRALGGIAAILARRLRNLRAQLQSHPNQRDEQPTSEALARTLEANSPSEVESEDDAVQLLQTMLQARDQTTMAGLVEQHAPRFNRVVFESLAFNTEAALRRGNSEYARALVELARFVTSTLNMSVGLASTLLTQMVRENRALTIQVEPGVRVEAIPQNPQYTNRVAEEVYRDGLRLMNSRPDLARERFEDALKLYEHLNHQSEVAACLGQLAQSASYLSAFDECVTYAARARVAFEHLNNYASVAWVLRLAGGALQRLGQTAAAIERFKEAWAAAQRGQAPDEEASAIANIGAALQEIGDMQGAVEWQERALVLKRALGNQVSLTNTLGNLAVLYGALGDAARQDQLLDEARAIAEFTGDRRGWAICAQNKAALRQRLGQTSEALTMLHAARAAAAAVRDAALEFQILTNLILTTKLLGQWDAVERHLDAAETLEQKLGDGPWQVQLLLLRVDVAMDRRDHRTGIAAAEALLQQHASALQSDTMVNVLTNLWSASRGFGDERRVQVYQARLTLTIRKVIGEVDVGQRTDLFVACCRAFASMALHGDANQDEALELLSRGVNAATSANQSTHLANLHGDRASILRVMGRLADALEAHRLALDLVQKGSLAEATLLTNCATALREVGQLQESVETFDHALTLARHLQATALEADILHKYATVAFDLGWQERSQQMSRGAAALAERTGDWVTLGRSKVAVAGAAVMAGEAARAEEDLRALLLEPNLTDEVKGQALGVLAIALLELGRHEDAIASIEQAVALQRGTAIEQATSFFYAGLIYRAAMKTSEATGALARALEIIGSDASSRLTCNIRSLRGDIYRDAGDLEAAECEYKAAVYHLDMLRGSVASEQDRLRLGDLASIPERLVDVLLRRERYVDAFDALEASKSRTLVERLGFGVLPVPPTVPVEMARLEREYLGRLHILQQRMFASPRTGSDNPIAADLAATHTKYDGVLQEMAPYAPSYVDWRRGTALTFDGVREILALP